MKIFSQPVVPISPVTRFACAFLGLFMWCTYMITIMTMTTEFSNMSRESWLFVSGFCVVSLPSSILFTAAAMNRFNGGRLSRRAFNWNVERLKRFLRLRPAG
ncbi:MAG: hypothetical protein RL095_550 [Verrucomicrobiota bacterium]|jgi:hypothetical protein